VTRARPKSKQALAALARDLERAELERLRVEEQERRTRLEAAGAKVVRLASEEKRPC